MKLNLLTILFSLTVYCVPAQITVSNTTFPSAGDTLKTVFDGMPVNININPGTGPVNATWDFTNLQGMLNQTVYRPAAEGSAANQFPSATLVTNFGVAGENYYRSSGNVFEFIGYQGPDPANLGLNLSVHINPPYIEKRAPINYSDFYSDDSAILVPIAADDIPGGLLDSLAVSPDSIRLRIAIDQTGFIDGWGSVMIPGGTYEVLREKKVEYRETRLDVKIGTGPFSVWLDVTDQIGLDFLGKDTTTTYNFYGENSKEAIAAVNVDNIDNDQVQFIEYKYNDVTTNVRYVNNGKPDMLAYPNPVMEDLRLEFLNLKSGKYTVRIYNILGVEVWKNKYNVNGNRIVKVDVSSLRKGTYLYSLVNENGKTISTKRLIVMRP